jgi:hypothetical protein
MANNESQTFDVCIIDKFARDRRLLAGHFMFSNWAQSRRIEIHSFQDTQTVRERIDAGLRPAYLVFPKGFPKEELDIMAKFLNERRLDIRFAFFDPSIKPKR